MHLQNTALVEQDLILVYVEEKPAFFARVERIKPDVKKNWWRVTMLVLQLPVKLVTWIIDNEQIRGADFTMGGIPIRMEKVLVPEEFYEVSDKPDSDNQDDASEDTEEQPQKPDKQARILTMGNKNSPEKE